MKIKHLLTSIVSCGLLATTYAVNAGVVIINNDSYVETYGFSEDAIEVNEDGSFDAPGNTAMPSSSYGDAFSSSMVTDAYTYEEAYMYNDIWGPDSYSSMSIGMDMSVYAVAETYAADALAYDYADSIFEITFTTDETSEFFFGAEIIEAFGSSEFFASLTNSSGDMLLDLYLYDDSMSPAEFVTGDADTYTLLVGMSAWADAVGGLDYMEGYATGQMYFEVVPTVVPVPATVWLFGSGLIGLIGLARRKC